MEINLLGAIFNSDLYTGGLNREGGLFYKGGLIRGGRGLIFFFSDRGGWGVGDAN